VIAPPAITPPGIVIAPPKVAITPPEAGQESHLDRLGEIPDCLCSAGGSEVKP